MRFPFLLLFACPLVACTFPSIDLADESGVADTGVDVDSHVADTANPDTGADTGEADTGTIVDTGVDTGPIDSGDPCDKDGDTFKVATCVPAPPNGQADCDDNDPSVHPGIDAYVFSDPSKEPGPWSLVGDWNCDGTIDKKYTTVNFSCSGLSLSGCTGTGFDGAGTCGQQGHLVTCAPSGLGCATSSSTNATQGCK